MRYVSHCLKAWWRLIIRCLFGGPLIGLVCAVMSFDVCAQEAATIDLAASAASGKVPLDEKKLWLPLKYQKHHLPLIHAATKALAQPRCYEIKRGSLDLRQSEPKRPIYRFLCKQASGKTYTEVIDGVTFESLVAAPTSAIACYELLMAQTKMMKQLAWLSDKTRASTKGELERYEWHFDAVSVDGAPLQYCAVCQLDKEGIPKLEITPRRG